MINEPRKAFIWAERGYLDNFYLIGVFVRIRRLLILLTDSSE